MLTKSEAMLRLEGDLADLEKRVERGDHPLDPGSEYSRLVARAMPGMTADERAAIQLQQLHANVIGAQLLSEHGYPVPGNDPQKPN